MLPIQADRGARHPAPKKTLINQSSHFLSIFPPESLNSGQKRGRFFCAIGHGFSEPIVGEFRPGCVRSVPPHVGPCQAVERSRGRLLTLHEAEGPPHQVLNWQVLPGDPLVSIWGVERRAEFSALGPLAGCFLAPGSVLGLVGTVSARR